jgi:hypothetical protein
VVVGGMLQSGFLYIPPSFAFMHALAHTHTTGPPCARGLPQNFPFSFARPPFFSLSLVCVCFYYINKFLRVCTGGPMKRMLIDSMAQFLVNFFLAAGQIVWLEKIYKSQNEYVISYSEI